MRVNSLDRNNSNSSVNEESKEKSFDSIKANRIFNVSLLAGSLLIAGVVSAYFVRKMYSTPNPSFAGDAEKVLAKCSMGNASLNKWKEFLETCADSSEHSFSHCQKIEGIANREFCCEKRLGSNTQYICLALTNCFREGEMEICEESESF